MFLGLHDLHGSRIESVSGRGLDEYLEEFPETPLEELTDGEDPEPVLADMLEDAERHEAGLMAAVRDEWGPEGVREVHSLYYRHGQQVGILAGNENDEPLESARAVFELLINYVYDGVPGDGRSVMAEFDDDRLLWRHELDLHRPSWEGAGADEHDLLDGLCAWISGILHSLDAPFGYVQACDDTYLYAAIARPDPKPDLIGELRGQVGW